MFSLITCAGKMRFLMIIWPTEIQFMCSVVYNVICLEGLCLVLLQLLDSNEYLACAPCLVTWAELGEKNGAGELVVNSIDTDGVRNGFDLELLKDISKNLSIPVIASGGAGNMEHFKDVFMLEGVDAGLAASIFHFKEIDIMDLKRYLEKNNIVVRI